VAEAADDRDLLALKVVAEGLSVRDAAGQAGVAPAAISRALAEAEAKGLVFLPASWLPASPPTSPASGPASGPSSGRTSGLVREPGFCTAPFDSLGDASGTDEPGRAEVFTLQWHITQACDLRCRHCYDRSPRPPVRLDHGLRLLDQLAAFCVDRGVQGQVSFSGGNPFLHPDFETLYAGAAERGFIPVVLGNPVPRRRLERLCAIARPAAYQVSLEGLAGHSDSIRGPGHFARTLEFLDLLDELGISSMVMLTLTRANQAEVLDLAEALAGRTGLLTFNRLSLFGQGASLACADPRTYPAFLERYLDAAGSNPVLGLKDNLLNLALERRREPLFGGCAGFGCAAAFSFLAVLSDGEVHACRKFPSRVGDLRTSGLADIYDSPAARAYRLGSSACRDCPLKPRCGGCLAVTASHGLDPLADRDPYCFRDR
jgi:selenobiotic family peptide radical SAM maturase